MRIKIAGEMVLSDFEPEKVELVEDIRSNNSVCSPSLPRDPSFSSWYDEEGKVFLSDQKVSTEADDSACDSDFELPLVEKSDVKTRGLDSKHQRSRPATPMMHEGDVGGVSRSIIGHGKDKFKPLGIENDPKKETSSLDISSEDSRLITHKIPTVSKSDGSFSVGDIIKTLVLVLLWYAFSTFLTM